MQSDLVYDVGMNNGDDTAAYLRQGYRVLGIDANPDMVAKARIRFAAEIADGRVKVLETAIAGECGSIQFWISSNPEYSSLSHKNAVKWGNRARTMQVPCTRFDEILSQYGTPHYLKVDIEGADRLCLNAIDPDDPPAFVSFEKADLADLLHMRSLGYSKFKLIDQENFRQVVFPPEGREDVTWLRSWADRLRGRRNGSPGDRTACGFAYGSSGPFGEETDGRWQSMEEVAFAWLAFDLGHTGSPDPIYEDWFDVHCAR